MSQSEEMEICTQTQYFDPSVLDNDELCNAEPVTSLKPWGRLMSLSASIAPIDLFSKSCDDANRYNFYNIGRSKQCDIKFNSSTLISNFHCQIFCRENKALEG
jgi:hypothetical protein